MLIEAVVADANVLLSAVIGKAAQKVFSEHDLKVHAAEFNAHEVREYLPVMAEKYALPMSLIDLRWGLLPLIIHKASEYAGHYKKALADLKGRDPEDAHALALARALGNQAPTKGTAAPTAPAAPTTLVAATRKRRRPLFTPSLLIQSSPIS